ncbi:4'-phosphopantetheinyl transferase family protein [Streptomyces sp. NPDC048436]|uniref:4'-phosphopantetheinyl transferase family protein n=1 Tax=Streptomyces sp. NPDC048436 TaxID=3365550 RepID=UPI00371A43B3
MLTNQRQAPRSALPEPVRIVSPRSWNDVRQAVRDQGTALLYTTLDDGPAVPSDPASLRRLLGEDFNRYESLGHPGIRRRFAASRALLKATASVVLGVPAESVELAYEPGGRPYLRGFDRIDISLSHTDDVLLVGVTIRGLVGVDVEHTERAMYGTGLAHKICTPHELGLLEQLPVECRNAELVRLWTLKEAYSKAIGQGLALRFAGVGFAVGREEGGVLRPDGRADADSPWTSRAFVLAEGYRVGAVVQDTGPRTPADLAADTLFNAGLSSWLMSAEPGRTTPLPPQRQRG